MILQLAPPSVIYTVAAICIAMSLFSQWFSKRFSIPRAEQMETQRTIQDLQARMKDAQGNQEAMLQMNQEMMVLMKGMYKKQIIPMMIRSGIWIGLWAILRAVFGDYTEFLPFNFVFGRTLFDLYILVSLIFSLVLMVGKLILRKLNPEKHTKKEVVVDHINALNNNIIYAPENPPQQPENAYSNTETSFTNSAPQKDWKKRLDD